MRHQPEGCKGDFNEFPTEPSLVGSAVDLGAGGRRFEPPVNFGADIPTPQNIPLRRVWTPRACSASIGTRSEGQESKRREAGDSETKRSDDVRAWRQSFSTGNSTPSSRRDVRSTYKRQRQARTARDKSPRDCKAVRTFGRRRTRVREIARPVRTFGLRRLEAVQALGLGRFRARNQICGARKLKPRPRRSHSKALEP